MGAARRRRDYRYGDDASDGSDVSDSYSSEPDGSMQVALRDKEDALAQSALARIRRAQEKGKTEVKLNKDELAALDRRRKRLAAEAAEKQRKGSGSSDRRREKRSDMVTIPIMPREGLQQRHSDRSLRSRRGDSPPHPPAAAAPPGMLVAGPDGNLTYAPIGYYPPQAQTDSSPLSSRTRSNTTSPMLPQGPYAQGVRHVSDGSRPMTSSSDSRLPLPHEEGWQRGYARSSRSNLVDPFDYQVPDTQPHPQNTGRRNVSAPLAVSYSSIPRSAPPPPDQFASSGRSSASGSSRQRSRQNLASMERIYDSPGSANGDYESDELDHGVRVLVEREPSPVLPPKERSVPARKPVSGKGKRKGK